MSISAITASTIAAAVLGALPIVVGYRFKKLQEDRSVSQNERRITYLITAALVFLHLSEALKSVYFGMLYEQTKFLLFGYLDFNALLNVIAFFSEVGHILVAALVLFRTIDLIVPARQYGTDDSAFDFRTIVAYSALVVRALCPLVGFTSQTVLDIFGNYFIVMLVYDIILFSFVSVVILLGMTFYYVILTGKLIQRLWFGKLRALEVEHLYERSWFSVMDTCLALTIFRDGFDLLFILRFGTLLFCKTFHWIIGDRVDFMEQSPDISTWFHLRMGSIMLIFFALDVTFLASAINSTFSVGPSMLIVFGFEYALLASIMLGTAAKYVLHTIDLNGEAPWEEKSIYFFYIDLLLDFFKLAAYIIFFAVVVSHYGIPLHIVRDVYITLRSFLQRCRDLIRYRQATRNMNERYPTATADELSQTDGVCIVCREEMHLPVEGPNPTPQQETPKKLPCGHLFHFRCLRSWLERQQSCPTCRQSVLDNAATPAQPLNVDGPNQPPQQNQNVQQRNEPRERQRPPRVPFPDDPQPFADDARRLARINPLRLEPPFELRFPRREVRQPESSGATSLPKVYPVHLTPIGPAPPSFDSTSN
ncbi:E3 ubiquitin-protein ligase hrd1 [Terramyces sp. JEL0728]|nr:E3 ubiquitin-protein ligase hrd1 [Terramyces sp. JEL0728]